MQPLFTYNVVPKLPSELEPLREMVYNLWWTWEPSARKLFRHLDIDLWERTNHSPLRMLQLSRQARLEEVAQDDDFIKELGAVYKKFKAYMSRKDTYGKKREKGGCSIAYFSAEFGFHESVPNYSGGLGILSGDHCKSASDLNLNFSAVGLLYRHGYFRQQINKEGWQETVALNQNFHHLPIVEVRVDDKPLTVTVELLGQSVHAKVWQLSIGRINLYLLDTDIPENSGDDRLITAQLYGGDLEMRIRQEVVLGVGGARALRAMGIQPDVHHMNEGHAAFLSLELMRRAVQEGGMDYYSALQLVASGNIFTTHTPVPAGNDAFSRDLMERYFADFPGRLGISFGDFFRLGQSSVNPTDAFSMTILALRTSRHANGVSALHGEVSRGLWEDVWSGVPRDEVPITSITNGIHTKTWMAPEFSALYDQFLGDWEEHLVEPEFWRGVIDIPDEALWQTHQTLKRRLIDFVRGRVRAQRERLGESMESIRKANQLLDPEILTIGFARRFATYKRGTLLFSDLDRLRRILGNKDQPVQFVFSGKAHPKDDGGKKFIQDVYKFSREPEFENRIVFVEDYDISIGRRLTQGVDLWLNNPLRPLEASGTSGMKLPPNGGLNLSVLDGWWCEGYNGKNGWAIGSEIKDPLDPNLKIEFQNEVDSASLFYILETQIIPLYYAKPDGRLPIAWLQLMRESIRSVTPVFNTHRMVKEYNERLYEPAAIKHRELSANNFAKARNISQWKARIRTDWSQVRISDVTVSDSTNILVGDTLQVTARVHLGNIEPEFVRVEAYYGESTTINIQKASIIEMTNAQKLDKGDYLYRGTIQASESGAYGLNVRVIPVNPTLTQAHELRLITWAR